MPNRILIHAVGAKEGGGLRHLNSVLKGLAEIDEQREYDVYIRESLHLEAPKKNIRFVRVPDEKSSDWLARLRFDLIEIPRLVKRERYSCIISLMNFGPVLVGAPHIFYQCNALYYSDIALSLLSRKGKILLLSRRMLAAASMRHADCIVAPSYSTRDSILETYPSLPKDRFKVIYHGFEASQFQQPLAPELKEKIQAATGAKLFYPANLLNHKGFDILMKIAASLQKRLDFRLFLTIGREEAPARYDNLLAQIAALGLQQQVVMLGGIPQQQMGEAYRTFDLMIYPSLVESFGFPLLEALAYGCPVVASDTDINQETCGDAALFYAKFDPDDGADKIVQALQPDTRPRLVQKGLERLAARDWSWTANARALLDVVEQHGG